MAREEIKDLRLRCPYCRVRTWMRDYSEFMRDHDRPDGHRCIRAASTAAWERRLEAWENG